MHAGCRYSRKQKRSLNSKTRVLTMLPGDLTSTPSRNTHLFQDLGNHSLVFYRKLQDFLQEVLYFYRKLPVESLDGPRPTVWEDSKPRSNTEACKPMFFSITHCCRLLLPPLLPCNGNTCTVKSEHWIIRGSDSQMKKRMQRHHALFVKAIRGSCNRDRDATISTVSACTRGGEIATGHPTGIP